MVIELLINCKYKLVYYNFVNNLVIIIWSKEFFFKICFKSLWVVKIYLMWGFWIIIVLNYEDVFVDFYLFIVSI